MQASACGPRHQFVLSISFRCSASATIWSFPRRTTKCGGLKIFLDTIVSKPFRQELEALGGYDTRETGQCRFAGRLKADLPGKYEKNFIAAILVAAFLTGFVEVARADEILVAAAASLTDVLNEIGAVYRSKSKIQ